MGMRIPLSELIDAENDRSAAILTNTQRDYLCGEKEPAHERQFRNRLRDRVRNGLIDGVYLQQLGEEGRKGIFEPLNDVSGSEMVETYIADGVENGEHNGIRGLDPEKLRLTRDIHTGATYWLSFLYASIRDSSPVFTRQDVADLPTKEDIERLKEEHGEEYVTEFLPEEYTNPKPRYHFDFETMLREAVEQAARERGEKVTKFNLTIETEPVSSDHDTDLLLQRFKENDPTLTYAEVRHLHSNTEITQGEIQAYHDAITEN